MGEVNWGPGDKKGELGTSSLMGQCWFSEVSELPLRGKTLEDELFCLETKIAREQPEAGKAARGWKMDKGGTWGGWLIILDKAPCLDEERRLHHTEKTN